MGLIVWTTSTAIEQALGHATTVARIVRVGVSVGAGLATYALLAKLARLTELHDIVAMLREKVGR